MHLLTRPFGSLALALLAASCSGSSPGSSSQSATTPPRANGNTSASGNETPANGTSASASGDDVRSLLTEALTPQMCPRLTGSFVGLSGDGPSGPAAGTTASIGRWWIRQCDARIVGDRLQLSLAGPGWTWVDREAMGFRIRQYILFEADAQLAADVQLGYDRSRRIASVWMTPAQGASAHVVPRGTVNAEATGVFSAIVGAALPLTGASANDRARAQAAELGSQMFQQRLSTGFTMTLSLATHQVDFMLGALGRGEVPERPFPSDTREPWQANARSMVWPGGLDVIGPIDVSASSQGLDVELEEGPGASVRVVCASAMTPYFDARLRGQASTVAAPPSSGLIELSPGSGLRHVQLPVVMTCPTLLLVAPRADSQLPIRVRYRVAPEGSAQNAIATPETPARPTRVRIRIVSASLRGQNESGHDWDVIGGEADPYVVVASMGQGREVDRTAVVDDNNNPQWNRWMPGAYDLQRDFPLRFSLVDEDGTTDEPIGSADLAADAVPVTAGDLSVPVRTSGSVPVQAGTLRLRVEPVN